MEETISLKELFQTLRKRLSMIVIIAAIATMTSGIVSYFLITPIYQSSTQLLVNQADSEQQPLNSQQIQTNLQLIETYNVIIKSPRILDLVKEELNTDENLNDKITVGSVAESQVLNITVEDANPEKAATIANTVAAVFQEEIKNLMKIDNVTVLSKAEIGENPSPIKPQPVLNMAIALVVGLMAGVGLAFLLEYLDNTVKTEQDIENLLEIPLLGTVTIISQDTNADVSTSVKTSRARGEKHGA